MSTRNIRLGCAHLAVKMVPRKVEYMSYTWVKMCVQNRLGRCELGQVTRFNGMHISCEGENWSGVVQEILRLGT